MRSHHFNAGIPWSTSGPTKRNGRPTLIRQPAPEPDRRLDPPVGDKLKEVAMELSERAVGGLVILDLNGRLTLDDGAQLLKDKVQSLVFQGRTQLVVNLAEVPYIDSGGLGHLVACFATVARAGGRLTLLNVSKRNHDLLSITKLVAVFDTFDSEGDAIESYPATTRV
jgi:anti-sigma B factor antagonist